MCIRDRIKNAIAPNKVNYREFIKDEYYLNTLNPTGTEAVSYTHLHVPRKSWSK